MRLTNLKKPGADIETNYTINLEIGFVIALLIVITIFRVHLNPKSRVTFQQTQQETVKMEDVVQTKQAERPPPPPVPPVPVAVPNDAIISDSPVDLNSELNLDAPLNLPLPPPPASAKDTSEENAHSDVFVVVERMPQLKGGIEQLQKSVAYPEMARKAGIEGRVYVKFIINEQGNVIDPTVVRGIGGGCDEAALDAVKKAKFVPGMQRGRPVKVWYTIPIVFKLQNQ
ncbi:MAG TPA: energy transducer TonB [Balneolales bacterium]|nr:energy transducer TonB [Balneolales bacterium]